MIDDLLLSGGADEKILEDFHVVAHCTAASGEDKFLPRPLQRLAHFLVGRSGGPNRDTPLYELCHLVNCIDAAGGTADARWRFFLGQDQVRSSSCHMLFREILAAGGRRRDGFEMTENGVSIHYTDGSFSISFGRMPFLVSLFEFLATMEGMAFHGELNDLLDAMVVSIADRRAIQDATNRIAAALRRYRSQHLVRSGNDEAFNTIQRFLYDDLTGSSGNRWQFDDTTILAFWQQHNTGAFRTYRNTFERFADFLDSVSITSHLRAVGSAAPLGVDREMGEVDPDDLSGAEALLDDHAAWQDPLPLLDQEPASGIKFLTKTGERALLSPLMAFGPFAVQLPLSFLRYLSYGAVQAAITTALQFHPNQRPPEGHVSCANAESYLDHQDLYRHLLEHLGRMQRATYYALHRASSGSSANQLVSLDANRSNHLFDMARRHLDDGPDFSNDEVAALEETAAGIFRRISRRGFDEDALADEDRLEGFRIGAGVLYAAGNILKRFLDTLQKLGGDGDGLSKVFDDDRTIFAGEFVKLYGVTDD
jgi:hypothetical protein